MSVKKQNTYIEKCKRSFKEVSGGCTVLHTKTIQLIRNPTNLAIYTYLSSKPPEWEINIKDIMSHFGMGKNKVYKAISDLIMIGLLRRVEIRSKGQFLDYAYYLYLSPNPENRETVSPIPEKPVPGLPVPGNRETYKEKRSCTKRKERKKSDSLNPRPIKPTQMDIQEHAAGVTGYEWVGEWLKQQN